MSMFQSMGITSSALTSQRLRMDVISSNMANVDTTRGKLVDGQWQPYTRKMVVMQPKESSFSSIFNSSLQNTGNNKMNGVKVSNIVEDESPYRLVYDPEHPDANEEGYVQMPNVDPLKEMVDLMSATRSYEANVTVFNASKSMYIKALELGK
ncbi:flagellar basal-body rod protein FlgC [Lederbergia wuyishanensis]|uniref:Flagellar basal-body rod protein FlgC n=2 Tax=Lederbergia wuyishanensis TaxID=1347903 RepID=A0ABU0CZR3_9BACI|nr:flagellar basal-body rod protein FlgC [Lederbergia wuyishanensis]